MEDRITVCGEVYFREGTNAPAQPLNGMKYVICRTHSAGVFAGYLQSRNGQEVVMRQARRLWQWVGAASLSELAMSGVTKPKECKFPIAVDRVELLQTIEILDCTAEAQKCIEKVPVWSMK